MYAEQFVQTTLLSALQVGGSVVVVGSVGVGVSSVVVGGEIIGRVGEIVGFDVVESGLVVVVTVVVSGISVGDVVGSGSGSTISPLF